MIRRRALVERLVVLMLLSAPCALAQTPPRTYLPDAADEDWTFLKHAPRDDVWDRVKYVPLGREDWFITFNGEVRYRPEGFRVPATSAQPDTIDSYLLQRYLAGANIRFGAHARAFVELQSGIVNGKLRSPRPSDRNSLDLHQAFVEFRPVPQNDRLVTVKMGRQALSVGSTRLISASPGLNVKRSFDGVSGSARTRGWTLSAAVARLVALRSGIFDDRSASGQWFWGGAVSRRSPRFERGELAAYYLGLDRVQSVYTQGVAPERRHTIGLKWSGNGTRVDVNYDALWQWGAFGGSPIRAWAFATETGLRIATGGWQPHLSVRADVASGDADALDRRLQTFNPLFPGNAYSGAVGLLGPANLSDLTPSFKVRPRPGVSVAFEAPSYWRTSRSDGIYATDLRPLIRPDVGEARFVGTNPGVIVLWQVTRHLQAQGVITKFVAGPFLEKTFVSSGFGFYSTSVLYRF